MSSLLCSFASVLPWKQLPDRSHPPSYPRALSRCLFTPQEVGDARLEANTCSSIGILYVHCILPCLVYDCPYRARKINCWKHLHRSHYLFLSISAIQSLGETQIELGPATVPAEVHESRDPQATGQLVGRDGDIADDVIETIVAQASSGSSSEDEEEQQEEEEEKEAVEEEERKEEEVGGETTGGDGGGEQREPEEVEVNLEEGELQEEEQESSHLQAPVSSEAQGIKRSASPQPSSTASEPSKEGRRQAG